jgi:dihydroxyacid dehydratase/phosphogluconate dehydratase
MGHPGTFHFRDLIEEVSNGVYEVGGKPADFVVSDICDGVVQATEGMNCSIVTDGRYSGAMQGRASGTSPPRPWTAVRSRWSRRTT